MKVKEKDKEYSYMAREAKERARSSVAGETPSARTRLKRPNFKRTSNLEGSGGGPET
jgi:hypothetical protein